ncbi:growth-regulated protein homolog gamma-like isoform X1 [Choloepus didactylus]|uniref:growth-regulated protein homolog gamma-like isoform X1 n=1 Tax=Choloepus didactylus TaxID=27675 RepID=UPI00189E05A0|nr:growth-regulated protein homolog gamma-like isoform X1 [Choloepus didactylus]
MARAATSAVPRVPRLLPAALLLLLVLAAGQRAAGETRSRSPDPTCSQGSGGRPAGDTPANLFSPPGAPVVSELRCHCLQTVQGIHFKNIESVKVTAPGAHCAQTEVIATLKNGQEACLNPEAPMVKKIVQKMLNR